MSSGLNELIDALKATPILSATQRLWDADMCGQYLGMSAQYFREHYACKPDFPGVIRLGDGNRSPMRWNAQDVIDWAQARKQ